MQNDAYVGGQLKVEIQVVHQWAVSPSDKPLIQSHC